jgi:hypothetical protein
VRSVQERRRQGHYQQLIEMNAADRTCTNVALVVGYAAPEEPRAMDADLSELTRSARGLPAGMLASGVRAEPFASGQAASSRSAPATQGTAPAAPAARVAGTERAAIAQVADAHADTAAPAPAPRAPKKKRMRDGRTKPGCPECSCGRYTVMVDENARRKIANAAMVTAQIQEPRHKMSRGKVCAATCSMRVWLSENGYCA